MAVRYRISVSDPAGTGRETLCGRKSIAGHSSMDAVLFPDAGRGRYKASVSSGRIYGGAGCSVLCYLVCNLWCGFICRSCNPLRRSAAASDLFYQLF